MNLAPYIEHTLLSPVARETDIRKLCEEAWIHQFRAVCVAPTYIGYTSEMLEFCPVKIDIVSVIGYPFGNSFLQTKITEMQTAIAAGATEVDIVMNLSQFKSMAYLTVREELKELTEMARGLNVLSKIIIETGCLDSFELHTSCEICSEVNPDFVKTSTGVGYPGANPDIIRTMRQILPSHISIKASGGIKTREAAIALIEAGADRIGTSSGISLIASEEK